jgi:hypothetical protein
MAGHARQRIVFSIVLLVISTVTTISTQGRYVI